MQLLEPKLADFVLLSYELRKISKIMAQPPSYSCIGTSGQNLESARLLDPKLARIVLLTYQLRKKRLKGL